MAGFSSRSGASPFSGRRGFGAGWFSRRRLTRGVSVAAGIFALIGVAGLVAPPSAYGYDYTPPFAVTRLSDGSFTTDFDIDAQKPAYTSTIYVGPTGDNTKDGLSAANKVRSLKQGIVRANALGGTVRLLVDPGTYKLSSVVSSIEDSFAGLAITCNLVIESAASGQRIISLADVAVPAFAATATDPTAYVSTYTTQSVSPTIVDFANLDGRSRPKPFRRIFPATTDEATIVAALNARVTDLVGAGDTRFAGASFLDTVNKKIYVKRRTGAALDADVTVIDASQANLNFVPAAGQTRSLWLCPELEVWGASGPLRAVSNSTGRVTVYAKGGGYGYSGGGHNFSASGGAGETFTVGTEVFYAGQDGFNYNGVANAGSIKFHEIGTKAYTTGLSNDGDSSCNSSTSHTDNRGVRVNCDYSDNSNRAVHDIQNSQTWNLGVKVSSNRFAKNDQNWDGAFCAGLPGLTGSTALVFLDSCLAAPSTFGLQAYEGAKLLYANMNVAGTRTEVTGTGSDVVSYVATISLGTAPVISSVTISDTTPTVGDVLAAIIVYTTAGNPSPTVTHLWRVGGTPAGTSATRMTLAADIGKTITCEVTATNTAGTSTVVSSATSVVVDVPAALTAPVIASVTLSNTTPKVGDTLTGAVAYSTAGNPVPTLTFDWKVDGTTVATTASYVVASGNVGKIVTLTATATNSQGSNSRTSAGSAPVAAAVNAAAFPTIAMTSATIDNASSPDAVVFDLPPLAAGEKRSFIASSAPDLPIAIGTSGKVLRGLTQWAVGKTNGNAVIRQEINGEVKNTPVTVTTTAASLTDADPNRYMIAGTRLGFPIAVSVPLDTQLSRLSRVHSLTPDYTIRNLRPLYVNSYVDGNGTSTQEIDNPNSITIDGASIEVAGVFYPVFFNGQSSVVLAPGAVAVGDPVIPNGLAPRTAIKFRTSDTVLSGQSRPGGLSRQLQNGEGVENTSTPQTSKLTSGSVGLTTVTGGTNNGNPYAPAMMLAQGWDGRPVGLIVGDSMIAAANDTGAYPDDSGCSGFGARGMDSISGGAQRYAHLNLGLTGSRASQASSRNAGAFRRRAEAIDAAKALNGGTAPFTFILSEHINNDTGATASNTDAGLRAVMQTWWNFLKTEYPAARLIQTTAAPNAQDSNNARWTTLADQTLTTPNDRPSTGLTNSNMRWGTSDWYKANKPTPLDGVLDSAAFFCDTGAAPNNAKWQLRSFATTVSAASAANATTIQMSHAPAIGEALVLDPGNSTRIGPLMVTAVTGSGPYTVNFNNVAIANAFAVGTVIKAAATTDGVHATSLMHKEAGNAVVAPAKLAGLFGATAASLMVTHTFDPAGTTPKTLAANWSELPDGAVVLLKAGDHGMPTITGAKALGIVVLGEAGAVIGKTVLNSSASKWRFKGLKFRDYNPGYDLSPKVFQNNATAELQSASFFADQTTSDITIEDCSVCCGEDSRDWTDVEWVYKGRNSAIRMQGANSVIRRNRVYNVLNGISVGNKKLNGSVVAGFTVENNYLENVAVDYIQHAANVVRVRGNIGRLSRHCYDNYNPAGQNLHGDFIHGYGAPSGTGAPLSAYDDIIIEDNDFDQGPFATQIVQGINEFDGKWTNGIKRRNKLRLNAYHGMTCMGWEGLLVEDNDIGPIPVTADPNGSKTPWLCVSYTKFPEGGRPPKNVIVRNNKAPILQLAKAGVYPVPVNSGSGYTTATVIFGPPTKGPMVQATAGTAVLRSGTAAIARWNGGEMAETSYDAPPSISFSGDGTGAVVIAQYCATDVFTLSGNTKPDGSVLTPTYITYAP